MTNDAGDGVGASPCCSGCCNDSRDDAGAVKDSDPLLLLLLLQLPAAAARSSAGVKGPEREDGELLLLLLLPVMVIPPPWREGLPRPTRDGSGVLLRRRKLAREDGRCCARSRAFSSASSVMYVSRALGRCVHKFVGRMSAYL